VDVRRTYGHYQNEPSWLVVLLILFSSVFEREPPGISGAGFYTQDTCSGTHSKQRQRVHTARGSARSVNSPLRPVHTTCVHGPYTRPVNTGSVCLQVENNYDIINNSVCQSRWSVFMGVQKWRPCLRPVNTARERGQCVPSFRRNGLRAVCRQRHATSADHPPRTAEPDAADQQHGGAAVRRQRRPRSDRAMVQEQPPSDAGRTSLSTAKQRLSADRRSVIVTVIY